MSEYVRRRSGLVVPASFAERPDPPDLREIATTRDGRDITRGFVDTLPLLPSQDSVLQSRGRGDLRVYEEIARDDQVKTCFEQRRLAVVSREWDVEPGGTGAREEAAAQMLREQLNSIRWDAVTDKMLWGLHYGYAVAECLWVRDGRRVALDAIKVRKQRRFAFDPQMELRLLTTTRAVDGEPLPPRKFWLYQVGADNDDEPYGLGLGHWLYWPTFFKRNGIKFWLIFLEKFGAPTTKGTYPPNAGTEERQRLLAALRAVHTDSAIMVPEGMVIELIEAARSGTVDYTSLYDRMDAAIAKVILGQTMTTDDGSSRAQAEVHMEVRQDLVKADADIVCESFNRSVARWLTEWNFGPDVAPPRVWRDIEDPEDLQTRAERDKTLFDMGFRPTLREIQETYGGQWVDVGPAAGRGPLPPPAFAADGGFPDQQALEDALEAIDDEALQAQAEQLLAPVWALIRREGAEAALGRLAEAAPDLDDSGLQEMLARVIFTGEIWGRLNA